MSKLVFSCCAVVVHVMTFSAPVQHLSDYSICWYSDYLETDLFVDL